MPNPTKCQNDALPLLFDSLQGITTVMEDGLPYYIGELWTSKQRQASSLHEISYRACYKPQLPRYFIQRLSEPGDIVLDPFGGRGTTALEAAMMGRVPYSNDVNPLSGILARPRIAPPDISDVISRLKQMPIEAPLPEIDLSMFYHPDTLQQICALRDSLTDDRVDQWIRMTATSRLTGHSSGFFSVYTLPPNQAVSQESQRKINAKRGQSPEYRNVHKLIIRKSQQLLRDVSPESRSNMAEVQTAARWLCSDARLLPVEDASVQLTVTSPPFLDIVQYAQDNWLRCWFNKLDAEAISKQIMCLADINAWQQFIGQVFAELYRVTKPNGWVAFEVGEVRKGTVKLEELVIPVAREAGFEVVGVIINEQQFTKTANIWGTTNNTAGTNTNRLVIAHKQSR